MNIDFIGVGAARCSTTWLYECLSEHPDICMPVKKELHFFDDDEAYGRGLEYYSGYFSNCTPEVKTGEITPRYMLYREAMQRIYKNFPNIKLIISLRDPVERALSQYKYFRFNKKKEPNKNILSAFEGCFYEDYIEKSLYYKQIKFLVDLFGQKNLKVVYDFEIKSAPSNLVSELFEFIGVDSSFSPKKLTEKVNYSQVGYHDPAFVWAKLNQFQSQKCRSVNGVTYGHDSCPVILRPILRNNAARAIFSKINITLDKMFSNDFGVDLDENTKNEVYKRYFETDVIQLENLLRVSLSEWKKNYE